MSAIGASAAGRNDDPTSRTTPRWLAIAIAIAFGLFYAYDAWEGVGNLVGLSLTAQSLDTTLSGFGLTLLIAGVVLPVIVFVLAVRLGRARGAAAQALLLLVGLCLIAAISADIFTFGIGSLIV